MTTTGQYVNFEEGMFDVYIILPECADKLTLEKVIDIEERVSSVVRMCNKRYAYAPVDVKELLSHEFYGEEYQIMVFDVYNKRGVI